MTKKEMFNHSFERPEDFFELTAEQQWDIDKKLGILDWCGDDLTEEEKERFKNHYQKKSKFEKK